MSDQPDDQPIRTSGTPRWVVVVGFALAAVVLVLMVVLHLAGMLGPGQH